MSDTLTIGDDIAALLHQQLSANDGPRRAEDVEKKTFLAYQYNVVEFPTSMALYSRTFPTYDVSFKTSTFSNFNKENFKA